MPEYVAAINAGYSSIEAMAATPDGGVVLFGAFSGWLETTGLVLQQSDYSGNDAYLMKRAADGSLDWVKQLKGNVETAALVVRPDGEIVLVGAFQDTANLGTGDLQAPGILEMFFTTISPDGTVQPPSLYGLDGFVTGVVQLDDGNLLVAAVSDGPASVGGVALQGLEPFLLGLSPTGEILFARGTVGTGLARIEGIAARPGGAALIGELSGPLAWDGVTIPGPSSNDSCVLALDHGGAGMWGSRLDPTPLDMADKKAAFAFSIAAGPGGRTLVGISTSASNGLPSIAFQTFDQDGTRLGHVDVGEGASTPWQMTAAADGDVLFVGASYGPHTIAGAHIDSANDSEAYVARLSATGELQWLRSFGAPESIDQAIHVVMSAQGRPIVGGECTGSFALDGEEIVHTGKNPLAFVAAFAE